MPLTQPGEVEMAAFLLWNIRNENRDLLVQSIVREHQIDIVLLVEYSPTKTRSDLSNLLLDDGLVKRSTSERFGVFGRLNYGMIVVAGHDRNALELWDWTPTSGVGGRFALVHGLDRMNNDDGTRRVFFRRVADLVKAAEATGHRRSIVVGDLNAQPFGVSDTLLGRPPCHRNSTGELSDEQGDPTDCRPGRVFLQPNVATVWAYPLARSRCGDALLAEQARWRALLAYARPSRAAPEECAQIP